MITQADNTRVLGKSLDRTPVVDPRASVQALGFHDGSGHEAI